MSGIVKSIWRQADAVCFDVDSTVIQEEGLVELAEFCGAREEVELMTNSSMNGYSSYTESLSKNLDAVKPSITQIEDFLKYKPYKLSPNIKKLICLLHHLGVAVYLVSGGFRLLIEPIAMELNVPLTNLFANTIRFTSKGDYADFDKNEYTSKDGGKAEVINFLMEKYGYKTVVMVGDGSNDIEASPPAIAFIGYGGNAVREKIRKNSKWFITDFQELIDELDNYLS